MRASRRGFTLTELLIVILIISLLAAMIYPALHLVQQQAKISKTKGLITRLHYVIAAQYDTYRSRRLPMDLRAYVAAHDGNPATIGYPEGLQYYDLSDGKYANHLARAKLNAIRDLIRLEMPDRWTDVERGPLVLPLQEQPALSMRYLRIYKAALAAAGGDPVKEGQVAENAAAECLYMIVMSIPDAAEQFHATDIGDSDQDGLPEFHDAWGRPIRFLRWPAGFIPANGADTDLQTGIPYNPADPTTAPDPFDPRGVLATQGEFPLHPLIYSAGPDGIYDINIGKEGPNGSPGEDYPYEYRLDATSKFNIDPFKADPNNHHIGMPLDANAPDGTPKNGEPDHYDNIHNHRLDLRQGR